MNKSVYTNMSEKIDVLESDEHYYTVIDDNYVKIEQLNNVVDDLSNLFDEIGKVYLNESNKNISEDEIMAVDMDRSFIILLQKEEDENYRSSVFGVIGDQDVIYGYGDTRGESIKDLTSSLRDALVVS